MTTHLELESTFLVDEATSLPDWTIHPLVSHVHKAADYHLDALYIDTEDLALTRAKITLRRRTGGSDDGWHIKLPPRSGDGARQEIHAALEDAPTPAMEPHRQVEIPPAIARELHDLIAGKPLYPIAQVTNHRVVYDLIACAPHGRTDESSAHSVIAEMCDDHVTTACWLHGGSSRAWREWEIELHVDELPSSGPDARTLLSDLGTIAHSAGGRTAQAPSKLMMALEGVKL